MGMITVPFEQVGPTWQVPFFRPAAPHASLEFELQAPSQTTARDEVRRATAA
jgi:hypothetical protein